MDNEPAAVVALRPGNNGFAKIIQEQQPYINPIKTAIHNSYYNFDTTTTINNLPEHTTVAGRIIGLQPDNTVFFMTVVMYNPAVGWWLLKQRRNNRTVYPQFWFDFGNNIADIFRTPNSYQIGPDVLADAYVNGLNNTFINAAANIRAMCQNIGSKNMNEFADYNTRVHGGPWRANYRNTEYVYPNNDMAVDAQYGIPFFLIGKYNPGVNDNNRVTFYSNIVSKMFLMTRFERIEELTRDERMRQIAIVAAILATNPLQQPRALPVINGPIVPEQNNDADAMVAAITANRPIVANQPIVPEQNNAADAMVAAIAANPLQQLQNAEAPRQNNDAAAMVAAIAANPLQQLQNAEAPRQNNDAAMVAPIADQNNYAAMIVAILAHLRPDAYKYFMDNFHILLNSVIERNIKYIPDILSYRSKNDIITEINRIYSIINNKFENMSFDNNSLQIINNNNNIIMYGTNLDSSYNITVTTIVNDIKKRQNGNFQQPNKRLINNLIVERVENFSRSIQINDEFLQRLSDELNGDEFGNTIFGKNEISDKSDKSDDNIVFSAELSNLKYFILLCKFVVFFEKWKNIKPNTTRIKQDQLTKIKLACNLKLDTCIQLIINNQTSLYKRLNSNIKAILNSYFYNITKISNHIDATTPFFTPFHAFRKSVVDIFTEYKIFDDMTVQNMRSYSTRTDGIHNFKILEKNNIKSEKLTKTQQIETINYIIDCYHSNLTYIVTIINFITELKNAFITFINGINIFFDTFNTNKNNIQIILKNIMDNNNNIQYKRYVFNGLRATIIPQQNVIANQPQVSNLNQRVARNGNVQQNRRGQPPANNINQQIAPVNNVQVRPNNQQYETAITGVNQIIRNINNKNVVQLVENTYKLGSTNFTNPPELNKELDDFKITNPQHIAVLQETVRLIREGY